MKTAFVFVVAFYLVSICEAYHYYVEIVFKSSSPSVPIYCFGTIIRLNDDSSFLGILETGIDIGTNPQMGPNPTVDSLLQLIQKNMASGVTIRIQLGPESDIGEWFQLDKFTLASDKNSEKNRLKISSPTLSSKLQNGQTLGPAPVKPAYTGQYDFGSKQSYWTTVRLSSNYQDDLVVNSTISCTSSRRNPTETDCGLLRIAFNTTNESTFNALILKDIKDWIIFVPKTPKTEKPEPKEEQLRVTVKTAAIDLKKKIVNCEIYFRPPNIEFKMELTLRNDTKKAETRIVESNGSIRENLNVMNINKPTAVAATSVWNWKLETWDDYLEHESEFTSKTFYKRTMLGDNGEWHEFDCISKLPARVMKCTGTDVKGQEIFETTPDKFLIAQYKVPDSETNQLP